MPITHAAAFDHSAWHPLPLVIGLPGVNPNSFCRATVCEVDAGDTPTYGDAYLTVLQCVPRDDEAVMVSVWIDNVDAFINYRITVFYQDFMANTPTFSVPSQILRGRGHQHVTITSPALVGKEFLWASVCEYDATGQTPLFGDAYLTVQQVVPGPDAGVVEVGVWIDNASVDLNFRVTVFGLS